MEKTTYSSVASTHTNDSHVAAYVGTAMENGKPKSWNEIVEEEEAKARAEKQEELFKLAKYGFVGKAFKSGAYRLNLYDKKIPVPLGIPEVLRSAVYALAMYYDLEPIDLDQEAVALLKDSHSFLYDANTSLEQVLEKTALDEDIKLVFEMFIGCMQCMLTAPITTSATLHNAPYKEGLQWYATTVVSEWQYAVYGHHPQMVRNLLRWPNGHRSDFERGVRKMVSSQAAAQTLYSSMSKIIRWSIAHKISSTAVVTNPEDTGKEGKRLFYKVNPIVQGYLDALSEWTCLAFGDLSKRHLRKVTKQITLSTKERNALLKSSKYDYKSLQQVPTVRELKYVKMPGLSAQSKALCAEDNVAINAFNQNLQKGSMEVLRSIIGELPSDGNLVAKAALIKAYYEALYLNVKPVSGRLRDRKSKVMEIWKPVYAKALAAEKLDPNSQEKAVKARLAVLRSEAFQSEAVKTSIVPLTGSILDYQSILDVSKKVALESYNANFFSTEVLRTMQVSKNPLSQATIQAYNAATGKTVLTFPALGSEVKEAQH